MRFILKRTLSLAAAASACLFLIHLPLPARLQPSEQGDFHTYILWVMGIGAPLFGFIHLSASKLRRQKVVLEKLVQERTQELREAALTDSLTGLRNRRFMAEVLQDEISAFIASKKYLLTDRNNRKTTPGESVFGIFIAEIDFFKKASDTYGHEAGDRVLKQFAAILKDSARLDDILLRSGGEEFMAILRNTQPGFLHVFAARVLKKVAETSFDIGGGKEIRRTCSIGYTHFPVYREQPGLLTFEQSTLIAISGMHHAKESGRNQGIYLRAGPKVPSGQEILQKTVTSLEYALNECYLTIGEPSFGPAAVDKA